MVLRREIPLTTRGKSYSSHDKSLQSLKLLTLARDLSRRKAREKRSMFVAEGVRSVEELLRSHLAIRGALVAPQLSEAPRGAALRRQLEQSAVEIMEVSEKDFRSAAETDSPQGVLAIADIPRQTLDTLQVPTVCRILVLDGIQDPGNVGTIVRTAAALGATATIALPGSVDLWNPKVIRSSMGAQFHHPALHASLEEALSFLSRQSIELWAADTGGAPLGGTPAPERLAIALGNEGAGISSSLRERAEKTVSLPISGAVDSLNVAVAAGILLYELRQ